VTASDVGRATGAPSLPSMREYLKLLGVDVNGDVVIVRCSCAGDGHVESLAIDVDNEEYECSRCQASGTGVVALEAHRTGQSRKQAANALRSLDRG
jgi:hypothetical protein